MLKLAGKIGNTLIRRPLRSCWERILPQRLIDADKGTNSICCRKAGRIQWKRPAIYRREYLGGECTAGKTHASILVDGTVVPCGHFRYSPEFYMGNINEKPFKEIWYSYDPQHVVPKQCSSCSLYKTSCEAGCFAYSHLIYSSCDELICKLV